MAKLPSLDPSLDRQMFRISRRFYPIASGLFNNSLAIATVPKAAQVTAATLFHGLQSLQEMQITRVSAIVQTGPTVQDDIFHFVDTSVMQAQTFATDTTAATNPLHTNTFTDLAVDAAITNKVTSASHAFVAGDVKNTIIVTGGATWVPGIYTIVSVAAGAATLDRAPAPLSATGGLYGLGGSVSVTAAGPVIWSLFPTPGYLNVASAAGVETVAYSTVVPAVTVGTADLAIDGANNKKVSSATHSFTVADVGNSINITGGTGFTVGSYTIVSVAANAATLDRSPGAVGIGSGVFNWTSTTVAVFTVTARALMGTSAFVHNTASTTVLPVLATVEVPFNAAGNVVYAVLPTPSKLKASALLGKVLVGAASATQNVSSTAGMVPGQTLHFQNAAGDDRVVLSITDATHVVLTATVTTLSGQLVYSNPFDLRCNQIGTAAGTDYQFVLEGIRDTTGNTQTG